MREAEVDEMEAGDMVGEEAEADLVAVVDVEEEGDLLLTREGGPLLMREEGEAVVQGHQEIERDLLPLIGSVVVLQW